MKRYVMYLLCGFLFAIVGVEVVVRSFNEKLVPQPELYRKEAEAKFNTLEAYPKKGELKIILSGTSMVRRGFDAETFAEALSESDKAAKFNLPGAQIEITHRWLTEEIFTRTDPDMLVLGVSSMDFNSQRPQSTVELYQSSRQTRAGLLGKGDRLLRDNLDTSKYRLRFQNFHFVEDLQNKDYKPDPITIKGAFQGGLNNLGAKDKNTLARVTDQHVYNYTVGEDAVEAFESLIEHCKTNNIEIFVVVMPVTSQYIDEHPNGRNDYDKFVEAVEQATNESDTLLIDHTSSFKDSDFADFTHMKKNPALELSQMVSNEIVSYRQDQATNQ